MKKIFLIFLMFLQLLVADSYDEILNRVSTKHNLSKKQADKILIATAQLIGNVQAGFTLIADSKYDYSHKVGNDGFISDILTYFKSEYSKVHVTSKFHNKINKPSVVNYLNHLAERTKDGNRVVKLEFDKEKGIHIDDTYINNGHIELLASVYQIYKSCRQTYDGRKCYSDVTKKTFVIGAEYQENKLKIYIDSIRARETYSIPEYNQLRNQLN